jgi:GPI mannosyltransferase 3
MAGPATNAPLGRAGWVALAAIFCIAFGLRLGAAILLPNIHQPDEIFQSLEQAHRVVFGYGIVPWEFREGARSWLLPGLLAAPMWLGDQLAPQTSAYRDFPLALIAALSSSTVVLAYAWGRRFGPVHAVLAAVALATWFELVYFGAKTLGEVVGSCFLFAGAFACSVHRRCVPRSRV